MEALRNYLLAIVAVSLIAVLAVSFLRNETMRRLARFVAGLLILLVVAQPLLGLGDLHLEDYFRVQTEEFSAGDAQSRYQEALRSHIQETSEQYIRDKAQALGATVRVQITLNDADPPAPCSVQIIGTLRADQMEALSAYIMEAFNIPLGSQEWKLYE